MQWNFVLSIYLLIFTFYSAYASSPLPGAKDPNLDMFTKQLPNRAYIDSFLATIPMNDSVAASNDIASHLSLRETIYTVPYGLDKADVVALLITDKQTKDAFLKVSKESNYHEVAQKDNFVAFQRR